MGTIQVPGRLSGRTYTVNIKGESPSETEQARIRGIVEERESRFAQQYEASLGKPLAEPDDGTALGRGISRGAASAKSMLGTTVETIGDKLGIAGLAEYGRGMEDAAAQRQFQLGLMQPAPTTREDVAAAEGIFPTIGKALTYAGEIAGEQVPQFGVGLAGGAAGAVAGGLAAGPAGAIAGFGVGSGLTEAPMLFGANVQRQEEEVAAGRKASVDLTDALVSTVGQATVSAVTNALGGAGVFLRPGAKLFTRAVSGAAVGGATESLNEVGQQVLERYQAGLPVDSPDAIKEYIDAGLAGGILGAGAGGIGGAAGGRRQPQAVEAAPATTPAEPGPTLQGDQDQGELFAGLASQTAPERVLPTVRPTQLELPLPSTEEQLSLDLSAAPVGTQGDLFAREDTPRIPAPAPTARLSDILPAEAAEDPKLVSATKAIEASGKATTKVVQEALGVNYSQAGAVLTKLEKLGVVSKPVGGKRKISAPPSIAPQAPETEVATNTTPSDVPKATVTAPPAVAVPSVNEAAAKADVPPAEPELEVPDVPAAAKVKSKSVGAGAKGRGRGVEQRGEPAGDVQPTEGVEAPEAGGLGGSLPVPMGTTPTAGTEPTALTSYEPMAGATPGATTGTAGQIIPPPVAVPTVAPQAIAAAPVIDEAAANTTAQTQLDDLWTKRFAAKPELASLASEYATPDAVVAKDPTTSADKQRVLGLFERSAVKKGKGGQSGAANAKEYFSRFKRPIDALEYIVADATLPNLRLQKQGSTDVALPGDEAISPVEREFFSGMSQERAKAALKWVEENMSPETLQQVRALQSKYTRSKNAKVDNKIVAPAVKSTVVGGRAASAEERVAFEQELSVQAADTTAKNAELKALADAARTRMQGLEGLLSAVQETKAPIPKRAVGMRAADPLDFVVDEILGLKQNKSQDVADLDTPLHPAVANQLRLGNLEMALRALQYYAPNARVKQIAKALAPYAQGTKVQVQSDLRDVSGQALLGQYQRSADGRVSRILLDSDNGMTIETLLHEMTHAATAMELFVKNTPMGQRLRKLFEQVKPLLDSHNGSVDEYEFVSEAFSNPAFQAKLSKLHPSGRRFSAFDQFANEVINFVRRLMGMQPRPLGSALDTVDQMIFQLLASPMGDVSAVGMGEISTPEGATVLLNRVAAASGSFSARTKESAQAFGDEASRVLAGANVPAKRAILGFLGMQPLADVAKHFDVNKAYDLLNAISAFDAASIKSDEEVSAVLGLAQKWVTANPNLKPAFDRLVTRSTVNQVDPSLSRAKAEKKYGKGSDKLRIYDEMQKDWASIGKNGHELYNNMRTLYRNQYSRLRAALEGKVDFVLSSSPELAAEIKKSMYAKFFDMNQIEPYFPLARTGDYWLEYAAFNPETGTTEPVKESYDSPNARKRAAAELESIPGVTKGADGKPLVSFYTSLDLINKGRTPDSLFVRDTLSIIRANLSQQNVDKATMDSIQQEITRMFVEALPETSFARSLQKRKNTQGYITDAVEALRIKGYNLGRQGVRYAYSNKLRAIQDEITEQGRGVDDPNKIAVIEELSARANFATNPPSGPMEQLAQTVNRVAFSFTIGLNVSSALVNLSAVPVSLYPYLAGRYGGGAASRQIFDAYKLFLNSGFKRELELPSAYDGKSTTEVRAMPSIDNCFVLTSKNEYVLRDDTPQELRAALQELAPLIDVASKQGQMNRSIYYDSIGVEGVGRSRNFFDRFSAISGAMFHQVERANRQVALVAAYKLELDRLRKNPKPSEANLTEAQRQTRAAERAVYQATEAGGGTTLATAPRWAQQNIGRVALMFKNYGLSLFYLQMKLLKQMTVGSNDPDFTPEDRRVAFRQLVGLQLSSFALAGVAGVPLYGAVSTIADAFLGEDEEDADMLTRRYLGEGLYKGFLSEISGLDISSRIGLTGLLISENRYNTNPSVEESLVAALGGPAWSTFSQAAGGVSEFYSAMTGGPGEMVRGIENMIPAAVRNFVKAGRALAEGGAMDTRRGDIIVGDLGAGELVGQALGFRPAKAALQQDLNQMKVRISKSVVQKRSNLSKAYYIALYAGDVDGAQEALEAIRAFNEEIGEKYPSAIIDNEFLKDSLKSHQRTTAQTESGVFINPVVRDTLRDLESRYNQGIQLF